MKNFGSRNFLEKFVVDELKTENEFWPPTIHYNRFSTPLRGVKIFSVLFRGFESYPQLKFLFYFIFSLFIIHIFPGLTPKNELVAFSSFRTWNVCKNLISYVSPEITNEF